MKPNRISVISGFLIFAFLLCCSENQLMAQWVQTDGPEGGNVFCFTSIDTMLFAGTENGVFRSANDGASWNPTDLDFRIVVSLAEMPNGDSGMNLFAGTLLGGVFLSSDNGNSWSDVNFGLGYRNIYTLAVKDTNLFAGTDDGVFLSPTEGAYWIPVSAGLTNMHINTFAVIDTNLYAGTDEGLFISANNGTSWAPTGLTEITVRDIAVIDTNLFVSTSCSGVLRSTDMGENWDTISDPDMDLSVPALAVIGNDLFAGTHCGIYRTLSNGDYWIPASTGLANEDVETLYVRGTDLFAGTYGGVYRSTNSGVSWTERNTGLNTTVVLSLITSGEDLYAAARSGVYHSNNSGNSWTTLVSTWANSIAVDGTSVYAGTWHRLVFSLNNGVSWDCLHVSDSTGRIFALAIMDSYIFAGSEDAGVIRIKYDAPGSWTIHSTGQPDTTVYCLAVIGTDLFAGTANGVYRSSNGLSWTPVNNGLTSLDVRALAFNGSDLFAGTLGGGVFRSTDYGASWTPVNNGLTDLALDVLSLVFSDNILFAGTWRGGIFLSKDNGARWTTVNTGLMNSDTHPSSVVHSLAVVGTDLFAGTRGASVWRRPLSEMIVPPVLSAVDSVPYPSEFIEVTSTDDGIIYLVPEDTEKDLTSIRGICLDSVAATANSAVNISLSGLDVGDYWLYARDFPGNLSDHEAFTIYVESDLTAPELSAVDSVYQPEHIEVTSTEDGIIYLVPEDTEKDLTSIRGACLDSVAATANSAVNISLSGLENGKYWLYARDGSDNISEKKEFTIAGVGIDHISAGQIRIFPTPTSKLITIQVAESGAYSIEIISMNGQRILSRDFTGKIYPLDLSSFEKGVYFITIRSKDFVMTRKMIKL